MHTQKQPFMKVSSEIFPSPLCTHSLSCVLPKEKLIALVEESKCSYCKKHTVKVKGVQWRGHGCTPSFDLDCSSCGQSSQYHTSPLWEQPRIPDNSPKHTLRVIPVLLLIGTLLSGLTYHQVSQVEYISY